MKMTRRAFVKANAAASAAAVAGITLPASAANLIASSDQT
ncbi:twin-arginine translocation signal domain-containing protein, partial [Vibrio navarrensis]